MDIIVPFCDIDDFLVILEEWMQPNHLHPSWQIDF